MGCRYRVVGDGPKRETGCRKGGQTNDVPPHTRLPASNQGTEAGTHLRPTQVLESTCELAGDKGEGKGKTFSWREFQVCSKENLHRKKKR